jgi:hypothetical protein
VIAPRIDLLVGAEEETLRREPRRRLEKGSQSTRAEEIVLRKVLNKIAATALNGPVPIPGQSQVVSEAQYPDSTVLE